MGWREVIAAIEPRRIRDLPLHRRYTAFGSKSTTEKRLEDVDLPFATWFCISFEAWPNPRML